jgi:Zn-finger nucleic acid-binding protein
MSQQSVKCPKCGQGVILDRSHMVAVGGGATPLATKEHEIMCPDCRVAIRFSDDDDESSKTRRDPER